MKLHTDPFPATVTAHLPVQLTQTDIAIAELLDEHSAMTTDQLTAILFDSRKQCRDRLRWLWKLQFVIPRPQIDWGAGPSEPENWTLTHESARFLARHRGQRSPTPDMVLKRGTKITESVWRGEILEGNDLFAHLINASRNNPDCQLLRWQSSATVAKRYGIAATGGHGVWRDGEHEVGFFLHRAHKPVGRNWVSELSAYAKLNRATGRYARPFSSSPRHLRKPKSINACQRQTLSRHRGNGHRRNRSTWTGMEAHRVFGSLTSHRTA